MAMIGGGKITPLGGAKTITLSDRLGVDEFVISDSDGFPIFKVMSNGTIKTKGGITKIWNT